MYSRLLNPPKHKSFFLFGPRGTGKSTWVTTQVPNAYYLDLLKSEVFNTLLASPNRLEKLIPPKTTWVILDEVQKIPQLLNEVHRLIERKKLCFILTGSSARKLRKKGTNLLAGRALTLSMYPLTAAELGKDFNLRHSLSYGTLPSVYVEEDPKAFLESYITTYLREEVQQEGLTRNLSSFSRFLEAASFSQASPLNISAVAAECEVERKTVENYFYILEDLLIATQLPVFAKRTRRRIQTHPKFFFFDVGVYRTLRPKGPLDSPEELDGPSLETLVFQELRAVNHYSNLGYGLYHWRTADQHEVDFVLYGERGIKAIEVKRSSRFRDQDLRSLRQFLRDYPMAKGYLLYGGERSYWEDRIQVLSVSHFFRNAKKILEDDDAL